MRRSTTTQSILTMAVSVVLLSLAIAMLCMNREQTRVEERPRATGFTTNYASAYLGATLTDFSRSCKGTSALLNDDRAKYMICSCEAPRRHFTVQLIRAIEVRIITLVNLEHFSSGVRHFTLLGSKTYPTNEWRILGEFEAGPQRGTQQFEVKPSSSVRFLRFLWASSHDSASWCTMTTFKAYGVDVIETLSEEYTIDMDDPLPHRPPSPPPPPLPSPENNSKEESPVEALPKLHAENDVFVVKLFTEDTLSPLNCPDDAAVQNASLMCFPDDRDAALMASRCVCRDQTPPTGRPAKTLNASAPLLHIITQMNKQIKALQQNSEQSHLLAAEVVRRLDRDDSVVRLLGTRVHEAARSTLEQREKVLDVLKELEVMRARLALAVELCVGGKDNNNEALWVWVFCSNTIALLALCGVLIVRFSSAVPRRAFSPL